MERYIFGINQHGIFKINRQTGKVWYLINPDVYQGRHNIKALFVYCIFLDNIHTPILGYLPVEENWCTLPISKWMNWYSQQCFTSFCDGQNFKEWAEDFDAYSNQSNEILDTLDLFIQLTKKKLQASSRPASFSTEVCNNANIGYKRLALQ